MTLPGFGSSEKVDRVDKGTASVREHSIEVGASVIAVRNIGTISIIDGSNSPWPLVAGAALCLLGLLLLFGLNGMKLIAFVFILTAAGLIYWGFTRKPDIFLSIGTCDGKRTNIVSKNRFFLEKAREFLRDKIDAGVGVGTINITAEKIEQIGDRG
jgi:hypothetical protein